MGNSRAFKGNTMDVILVVKIINRQMEYVDDPLGMGKENIRICNVCFHLKMKGRSSLTNF